VIIAEAAGDYPAASAESSRQATQATHSNKKKKCLLINATKKGRAILPDEWRQQLTVKMNAEITPSTKKKIIAKCLTIILNLGYANQRIRESAEKRRL
jgi:hypothetical protein